MALRWTWRISKRRLPLLAAILAFGCGQATEEPPPQGPAASFPETVYDFGEALQGTTLQHVFLVENRGSDDLSVDLLKAPDALSVSVHDPVVPPQGRGEIEIAFETRGLSGSGNLQVELKTNDPEKPTQVLVLRGRLVPPVEIQPQNRVYFFDVIRGQTPRKDVDLINHQDRSLNILEVRSNAPRYFETTLETLESGQRYRLALKLEPHAPSGRLQEEILVITDSPDLPEITIYARAAIREIVHAEPEGVHFSTLLLETLSRQAELGVRRLRISKHQGRDFKLLNLSADIPFVETEVAEEKPGESYTVTVRINGEKAVRGEIAGSLLVQTNDPDFPTLKLPITGKIL